VDAPLPSPPIPADPFAFWPARASRVAGLGGERDGQRTDDDPAYVFHSAYLALPAGTMRARLRFSGLKAETGVLAVGVNALLPDGSAERVRDWPVRLGALSRGDGVAVIEFEARDDCTYAVLGNLYDDAAASAEGLTLVLERVERSSAEEALARARAEMPERPVFRRATALLSDRPATLADPVSQTCTAAQFDEPAYARWLERLKLPRHRHRKQWEFVYVLQVLERYGALVPGARGLGFGVGSEPLPALMAAMGCSVTATDLDAGDPRAADWAATDQHGGLDALRRPEICDAATFAERVAFRAVDMGNVPGDLTGYDFTWSTCALEHLGSIRAGAAFVERSLQCLRPGGLAVHTTELNCSSDADTVTDGGTVLFRRRDLDRLAVELVSHGHGVAQLKYDLGDLPQDGFVDLPPYGREPHLKLALEGYVTTSFGMVVRRAG